MAAFAQIAAANPVPGKTLVLEPWVFADEWSKKPREAVCVGLRLLADTEKTKARATAEELADQVHPRRDHNWLDCFNDCVIRQVDALAICDPNDVRKAFELMPFAESDVSDALTSKGALFIFEALDAYETEVSVIGVLADRPELDELAVLLPKVDPLQVAPSLRRLISRVIEELDLQFGDEESVDAGAVDDASDEVPIVIGKKRVVGDALGAR